jgi:fucose 4-O-acetylase-like acetyltransferase
MARDPAFDTAKGLGIILVMLGHLDLPFWLINSIYFFHMPLFIIISGYFHKDRTPREVANSTGRLYMAYLVYGVTFLFISWVLTGIFECNSLTILVLAKSVSIWSIPYFGIFWFIIALMIIRAISQFVKPNIVTLSISLCLFFIVWYLQKWVINIVDLPFGPAQVIILFPFYIIGYQMKDLLTAFKRIKWIVYASFIIIGILSIVLTNGNERKIVNYHQLALFNPVIALVLATLGSISLILLSDSIAWFKTRITSMVMEIGEFSFTYFALHLFIFSVLQALFKLINVDNTLLKNIFMLLGTILICRLAIITFQKLKKILPAVTNLLLLK